MRWALVAFEPRGTEREIVVPECLAVAVVLLETELEDLVVVTAPIGTVQRADLGPIHEHTNLLTRTVVRELQTVPGVLQQLGAPFTGVVAAVREQLLVVGAAVQLELALMLTNPNVGAVVGIPG